jgi:N-(5'phosphoribosyl)anthranilate (PRA) isomerase
MLTGVTITGADDAVDLRAILALSVEFPFVEWGILMSESRAGSPRYPTRRWMIGLENLARDLRGKGPRLSAHFCGAVARSALVGDLHDFPVIERMQRIQLNGYRPGLPGVAIFARMMPCYEIVLQVRAEDELQQAATEAARMRQGSILFDPSGGRGVEPFKWPWAPSGVRIGYTGGITPDNVDAVVGQVAVVASDFWIDMESGVRTDDRFDLSKVRQVLERARRFIREDGAAS